MILKILLNLSVLTLTLGQFTAIFKQGDSNLYLFDLILGLFSIYGLFYFFHIKRSFRLPSVSLLLLSFSFIALISLLKEVFNYTFFEFLISGFYLIRWFVYLISAIIVYNMFYFKVINKEYIIKLFVSSGLLLSIIGFIQLIVLPDFTTLDSSLGWDPHKNRLASSFFDPNFVGAYLNLVLIFLIDKYYKNDLSKLDIFKLLVIILAIFLTFSRSAWLMLSVIIFVYGLLKSKALLITFVIVAFSAYFAVPRIQTRISGITDPSDSAYFRFISWSNTLDIANDHLLLGIGFNTFRYVQKDYGYLDYDNFLDHSGSGADSSILFILATTGIFGLLFYISGLFSSYISSNNLITKSFILGMLLNSLFINSLFYPSILFLFLIVIISYSFFDT